MNIYNTYEDLLLMVSEAESDLKSKIKRDFANLFDLARQKNFKFDEKEMGGWEYWDRMTFTNPTTLFDTCEESTGIAQCTNDNYHLYGDIHFVEQEGLDKNNYPITNLSVSDMLLLYRAMLDTLDLQ